MLYNTVHADDEHTNNLNTLNHTFETEETLSIMDALAFIGSGHTVQKATFDELSVGKENQRIRARLLRFWSSAVVSGLGEPAQTTLLLLDEKGSMINAFIPPAISSHYHQALSEGAIYVVAHFEVVKCLEFNKTTEHPYAIRFLDKTKLQTDEEDGPTIQLQKFMVRPYDHLKLLANTGLELPDVVGLIKSVKGYGLTEPDVYAPILLRFLIAPDVEVDVALLGDAVAKFKALLNAQESTHPVILVTSLRPLQIGDTLYLTTTTATSFFPGPSVHGIVRFARSLGVDAYSEKSKLDSGRLICGSQIRPIGDLNSFLSATNTQEILLGCKARVVDIIFQSDMCVLSGTDCMITTEQPTIDDPRHRVEVLVDDGTNYAMLSVAYKDILRLAARSNSRLLADEVNSDGGNIRRGAFKQLRGHAFMFHVIVADRFMSRTCPFTVCGMSELIGDEAIAELANQCVDVQLGSYSGGIDANNT